MREKGGVVDSKIVLQIVRHDKLENGRNASIFSFVTDRFSMSYKEACKRASFAL